jgi:hypothetical protein
MSVVPFALVGSEMTAVLPDLLGTPGKSLTIPYSLSSIAWACVSKEFMLFALNRTSPVVGYLRELAAHEHQQRGGPGVGTVGRKGVSPSVEMATPSSGH